MPCLSSLSSRGWSVLPLLALAGCHPSDHKPAASQPIAVEVIRAVTAGRTGMAYAGVIRSRRLVTLAFRQGGRLQRLLVQPGDRVRKGQLLATIDRPEGWADLDQARGEFAAAAAAAAQARDAAERSRGLDTAGALSPGEVRDRGRAALAADGKAQAAAAAVRLARTHVADGELRASDDGEVVAVPVEAGAVVGPGVEIVRLAAGGREAEVRVPDDVGLHVGDAATVHVDRADVPANVRAIDPAVDPATRQRVAHLALRSPVVSPAYGGLALATFGRTDASRSVRLPQTAIMSRAGGASVWEVTADGRHVRRRRVVVTDVRGADALVSGLPANMAVVATGAEQLHDGAAIRVVQVRDGF